MSTCERCGTADPTVRVVIGGTPLWVAMTLGERGIGEGLADNAMSYPGALSVSDFSLCTGCTAAVGWTPGGVYLEPGTEAELLPILRRKGIIEDPPTNDGDD